MGTGEPFMATRVKTVNIVSVTPDGLVTIPEGLVFTIHPRYGRSLGGVIEDKGLSFPDPETGKQFALGSKFWRASGTIQMGAIKQEVGIHMPMFDANNERRATPIAGAELKLPENTHFWKTSGSRWELYVGDQHPAEKYNIDPASYGNRYARPDEVQATTGASAGWS